VKLLAPLILLLSSVGCARGGAPAETQWIPDRAADLGAVVARVGSVPIYAHEVEAQAVLSHGTPREALAELVSLHLLAEGAHRRERFHPDWSDPELRSALAERLIEREIMPQLRPDEVPEPELRAIYQRAIDAFVHPRLVDVGLLAVYTGSVMKAAARLTRAEAAKSLEAYVASQRIHGPEDFEAIARDPTWQDRHVIYRRMLQGLDGPLSRKVGTAVARLKAPGDTTSLIEDDDGFFLATYAGEKPPENVPFADVREKLRQRYYEHWRSQRIEQLMSKISERHHVESHPHLSQQL
jgi:hypothetical protein